MGAGGAAGFDGDAAADLSRGSGTVDVSVGVGGTGEEQGVMGAVQLVYDDSVQVESFVRADGLVETAVG